MRVACVGGLAFVLAACSGAATRAADHETPLYLAPSVIPTGWHVMTADSPAGVPPSEVQTLYARDADPEHDGLLVAEVGEDSDIAYPEEGIPVPGLSNAPGHPALLAHFGDYTVIGWYRSTERATLVVGRGLVDAEVVRAARGAEIADDVTPTIPTEALPHGYMCVAAAQLLPRQRGAGAQEIWLGAAGGGRLRISMSDLDDAERHIDHFLAGYPRFRSSWPDAQRNIDGRTVFVTGNAPAATVDAVTDSIEPVTAKKWRALQARA